MPSETLASVEILNEPEGSFYSLDGGASRIGPFKSEEVATTAAMTFLEQQFTAFVKSALFGA